MERDGDALLAAEDVAAEVGNISTRTARRLMRRMEHIQIGKLLRVTRRALRQFLEDVTCDETRINALQKPVRAPSDQPVAVSKPITVRPIQPRRRKARIPYSTP